MLNSVCVKKYTAKILFNVSGKIARCQVKKNRAVSSEAERAPDKGEVPGSIPGRPNIVNLILNNYKI